MAQETLEETQRRLGFGRGSARAVGQRPPSRTPVVIAIVAVAVISALVGVGIFAVSLFQSVTADYAEQWRAYPGTAEANPDDVLLGESLDDSQITAREMTTDVQRNLAGYGFRWEREEGSSISLADNGFGAPSMLYDFEGDTFVGQVLKTRRSVSESIIEKFATTISEYPGWSTVVANYEQDGEESAMLFGSSIRDEQALWTAVAAEREGSGIQIFIEVFDAEALTVEEFTPPDWIPAEPTDTIFVRITASGRGLLAESDRDAFIAALEPFRDRTKPNYRG